MPAIFVSGEPCEISGFYWPVDLEGNRAAKPIVVNEQFPPFDGHFILALSPEAFASSDMARSVQIESAYRDLLPLAKKALEELPPDVGPAGLFDAVKEGYELMGMAFDGEGQSL